MKAVRDMGGRVSTTSRSRRSMNNVLVNTATIGIEEINLLKRVNGVDKMPHYTFTLQIVLAYTQTKPVAICFARTNICWIVDHELTNLLFRKKNSVSWSDFIKAYNKYNKKSYSSNKKDLEMSAMISNVVSKHEVDIVEADFELSFPYTDDRKHQHSFKMRLFQI